MTDCAALVWWVGSFVLGSCLSVGLPSHISNTWIFFYGLFCCLLSWCRLASYVPYTIKFLLGQSLINGIGMTTPSLNMRRTLIFKTGNQLSFRCSIFPLPASARPVTFKLVRKLDDLYLTAGLNWVIRSRSQTDTGSGLVFIAYQSPDRPSVNSPILLTAG